MATCLTMDHSKDNLAILWEWLSQGIPAQNSGKQRSAEEAEHRLENFASLCQLLGNPQDSFASVQVTGSKGKGQTASFMAHALAAQGFRVGLFASPHVHHFTERIRILEACRPAGATTDQTELREPVYDQIIAGRHCKSLAEQSFYAYWQEARPGLKVRDLDLSAVLLEEGEKLMQDLQGLGQGQLHFFMRLCLLAFVSFKAMKCDWVVLEAGIGGRLCPTNIVQSKLGILTHVELEHTELLGDSLEKIAWEKAGIMKEGAIFACAQQAEKVYPVLRAKAESFSNKPDLQLLEDYQHGYECRSLAGKVHDELPLFEKLSRPFEFVPHLAGFHGHRLMLPYTPHSNLQNLSLCILALEALAAKNFYSIAKPSDLWQKYYWGLAQSRLPGRFASYHLPLEGQSSGALIVCDAAHTPASVACLVRELGLEQRPFASTQLLFAAIAGKNYSEMAEILAPHFASIRLNRAGSFKPSDLKGLERAFQQALERAPQQSRPSTENPRTRLELIENSTEALEAAINELEQRAAHLGSGKDEMGFILICGSFYLLAELIPQTIS